MTADKHTLEWKAQKTYAQNRIDSKAKADLPPLTPEEEARPFAKYFYEEIKPYDPAHYAAMEKPVDPARGGGPPEIKPRRGGWRSAGATSPTELVSSPTRSSTQA
jgi:hypothetical protein